MWLLGLQLVLLLGLSVGPAVPTECSIAKWWSSLGLQGVSKCDNSNWYIKGLYRNKRFPHWKIDGKLSLIEEAECCKPPAPFSASTFEQLTVYADWWSVLDERNRWATCPRGFFLNGLYRNKGDGYLHHIELGRCTRPAEAPRSYESCYHEDVSECFDDEGWCKCTREDYFVTGFYRGGCDLINCIDKLKCCKPAKTKAVMDDLLKVKLHVMDKTLVRMAYLAYHLGYQGCAGCSASNVGLDFERQGTKWVGRQSNLCRGNQWHNRLGLEYGDWSFAVKEISYGKPVYEDLVPVSIDSGNFVNNASTKASQTISKSYRCVNSVTHTTTSTFKSSHQLGIELSFSVSFFATVESRMSYKFGYESSTTTTDSNKKENSNTFSVSSTKELAPHSSAQWSVAIAKTRSTVSYRATILIHFSTEFQGYIRRGEPGSNFYTQRNHRNAVNYKFGNTKKPFYEALREESEANSRPWRWDDLKTLRPSSDGHIRWLSNVDRYTFSLTGKIEGVAGKHANLEWHQQARNKRSISGKHNSTASAADDKVMTTVMMAGPDDPPAPSPDPPQPKEVFADGDDKEEIISIPTGDVILV